MKNKLVKQILTATGLLALVLSMSAVAYATSGFGTDGAQIGAIAENTNNASSLRELVITIINYFLGFLGLLAVIMVVYGGVTYVTSAGNDEAIGNAKKIILYAVVGIVIILLSFVIVNTVIGAGGGVEQ